MSVKIVKKLFIFCLFGLTFLNVGAALDQLIDRYGLLFLQFEQELLKDDAAQKAEFSRFASFIDQPYQNFMKQIRADMHVIKKIDPNFYQKLSVLYKFLQKNRIACESVLLQKTVQKQWGLLFVALQQGQDIEPLLKMVNIDASGRAGLKLLIRQVEKQIGLLESYDCRLHADWIDAKLENYVKRVELIRLRNAILFHPVYKRTKLKLHSNYPR